MTLEQRVSRLERQNRRLKLAGAVIVVLAMVAVVMGQRPDENEHVIQAERFEVVDRNGELRAVLGMDVRPEFPSSRGFLGPFDPGFALIDENGGLRVLASVTEGEGAGVVVFDQDQERVAGFASQHERDQHGIALTVAQMPRAAPRVSLQIGFGAERPRLEFVDADGEVTYRLPPED